MLLPPCRQGPFDWLELGFAGSRDGAKQGPNNSDCRLLQLVSSLDLSSATVKTKIVFSRPHCNCSLLPYIEPVHVAFKSNFILP